VKRTVRAADAAMAGLAFPLFAYSIARATQLSFTHDESFSYVHWMRQPLSRILAFDGPETANNHFLNTLLSRLAANVFGPSELALRLCAVLSHALFLLAAALIFRRLGSPILAVAGFVVVTFNPFLLDFFSVSRGYGPAMAFLALAVHFLLGAYEEPPVALRRVLLSGICVLVASLFNFAFLIPGAAVLAAGAFARPSRTLLAAAGAGLVTAAVISRPLQVIKASGHLYAGGKDGFLSDTADSLVRATLYGMPASGAVVRTVSTIALLLLGALLVLAMLVSLRASAPVLVVGVALPVLSAGLSVLEGRLTGQYPMDRTAIYFLLLFSFALFAALDFLASRIPPGLALAAGGAVALAAFLHFGRTANLHTTLLWRADADTRQMLKDLSGRPRSASVRLRADWGLDRSIDFYRIVRGLDWLADVSEQLPNPDYLFSAYGPPKDGGFRPIAAYPYAGHVLYESKTPPLASEDPGFIEDPDLTGSIDEPAEGSTVKGPLVLLGWARVAVPPPRRPRPPPALSAPAIHVEAVSVSGRARDGDLR
jgi:hypothetical protein